METLLVLVIIAAVFCVSIDASRVVNDDTILQMLDRIEALEKKDQENTLRILNLETKLERHEATNKRLHHNNYRLEKQVAEQNEIIIALKTEVQIIRQSPKSNIESVPKQEEPILENNSVTAHIPPKKRLVLDAYERPIAFQARILKYEVDHIGLHQKILFDDVLTNLGKGYHNLQGIFIAPRDGLYIFSASILSNKIAHPEFIASIMKQGATIANIFGHGDAGRHDQGSATIVTPLVTGDEVWVELIGPVADDSIWGANFTSFMGCLIIQQ